MWTLWTGSIKIAKSIGAAKDNSGPAGLTDLHFSMLVVVASGDKPQASKGREPSFHLSVEHDDDGADERLLKSNDGMSSNRHRSGRQRRLEGRLPQRLDIKEE